jgi:hypothetical protein
LEGVLEVLRGPSQTEPSINVNSLVCIAGFVGIQNPLTQFMEEKEAFHWSPKAEAAFWSLKKSFCTASILRYW